MSVTVRGLPPLERILQTGVVVTPGEPERRVTAPVIAERGIGYADMIGVLIEQVLRADGHGQLFGERIGHVQVGDPFG